MRTSVVRLQSTISEYQQSLESSINYLLLAIGVDALRNAYYNEGMIRSFKDKKAQALYEGKLVRRFQGFVAQAERRLQILDSAIALCDLQKLPSNRFESLKGDRAGQYSIRVNKQWRICFVWQDGEPCDVEIIDYH